MMMKNLQVFEHTCFFGNCGTVILNLWCHHQITTGWAECKNCGGTIVQDGGGRRTMHNLILMHCTGWHADRNCFDCLYCLDVLCVCVTGLKLFYSGGPFTLNFNLKLKCDLWFDLIWGKMIHDLRMWFEIWFVIWHYDLICDLPITDSFYRYPNIILSADGLCDVSV